MKPRRIDTKTRIPYLANMMKGSLSMSLTSINTQLVSESASLALVLLILSVLPCNAQRSTLLYDQLIRPQGAVYYHAPIGLCEDYPEETTTIEIIRNDMELLKRSGIGLLRISFGWDGIETEKDKYYWGFWDDYVRIAVDEYGITLIPYICYTPQWNSTGDSTNFWNHIPIDFDQFGEFVGILVNRYKDWIKSWELWNEPDIDAYWSGTVEEYSKLLKIGAQAVRKADPNALVVCGGLAHDPDFTLALFRDHGISPYVDVVNIHSYYETWNGLPLENIVGYVEAIADIINRYGNRQALWMAEVGYSTFRKNGYVSEQYSAYYDYEHTPGYQAVHLIRTIALLLSTEKLSAIAWYEIKDLQPSEEVIGDVNNRHLGVAYVDHRPKPAEEALSFFDDLFVLKTRCIDDNAIITRALGSKSEVHCFEDEEGAVIVIGWLKTHLFGRREGKRSGDVKDTRKETVELTLPYTLTGKATLYDELGNEEEFREIVRTRGKTTVKELNLAGGDVVIIKISE